MYLRLDILQHHSRHTQTVSICILTVSWITSRFYKNVGTSIDVFETEQSRVRIKIQGNITKFQIEILVLIQILLFQLFLKYFHRGQLHIIFNRISYFLLIQRIATQLGRISNWMVI